MKIIKSAILLIVMPVLVYAQDGGSLYTRYGIGDLYNSYTASNLAMGETGISLRNPNNISSINPAGWSNLVLTRLEVGANITGFDISDQNAGTFYSHARISGFTMGFPIDTEYGIVLVTGLIPISNVSYRVSQDFSTQTLDNYSVEYSGSGGLSKLFLGLTYKLPFDFSVGASFEYYTGKIENSSAINFDLASSYKDGSIFNSYVYHGIGFKAGLISSDLSKLFDSENIKDWRIGAYYNYTGTLTTDTSYSTESTLGSNSVVSNIVDTKIPFSIGVGTSFVLNSDLIFALDYNFQPWSEYRFNKQKNPYLDDLSRYSMGVEYHKSGEKNNIWEQLTFRGGLSYESSQYRINNEKITQYSIYTGFSVPLGVANSIDVGFQYGVRGNTNNNLLKEKIYNLSVSISLGQLWFVGHER